MLAINDLGRNVHAVKSTAVRLRSMEVASGGRPQ
jgi:hypothetical protein